MVTMIGKAESDTIARFQAQGTKTVCPLTDALFELAERELTVPIDQGDMSGTGTALIGDHCRNVEL